MSLPKNYHPHSRFRMLEKPGAYPGLDIINNTQDGPVFDLGVDMDSSFGVGYIQVRDIVEMAHVLGFISPEESDAKDAEIAQLKAQINRIPYEVESFTNELQRSVNSFLGSLASNSDLSPVVNLDVDTKPEAEPEELSGDVEPDNGDEPEALFDLDGQSDGSNSGKGSNELSGDSVDELIDAFGFSSDD